MKSTLSGITFLFLIWLSVNPLQARQAHNQVKFYTTDQLDIDVSRILSHRIELRETAYSDSSESFESHTFLTVDPVKQFGERQLLINWMAVTKFGTGLDLNLVSGDDLRIRYRITPHSIPFGVLVESHAFDKEVNIAHVNVDAATHKAEIETVYPNVSGVEQRPTLMVEYDGYNSIVIPYVLALLGPEADDEFILPGISSYSEKQFFSRISKTGEVRMVDTNGHRYDAITFVESTHDTIDSARDVTQLSPGRRARYFVSSSAPWFLGKEWFTVDDAGDEVRTKTWRFVSWQLNEVSTLAGREMAIDAWKEIQSARQLSIPWYPIPE